MMNLHKIWTISKFKIYQIVVNMQILPILLMGMIMPVAMNFILPRTDEFAQGNVRSIMIISMGFIFIAGMGSAITGMMSLVEEKEKKTLRVLMTSTVTSLEFLIATLLPTVVLLLLLSYLLIPLSGMSFSDLSLLKYGVVSLSTIVSGSIIGFISGIFAKNSSEATAYSIFPLMILILVPFYSMFNETLAKVAPYLYTNFFFSWSRNFADASLPLREVLVALAWLLGLSVIFILLYRHNGLEKE